MSLRIPEHGRSLGHDMNLAFEAAAESGEIVRNGYGNLLRIESKGVGDLVSEVDRAADLKIQQKISFLYPKDDILSEELSPNQKEDGGRMWVVDPLDGSSAFLFQVDESITSVMIALRERFETQLAVMFFPLTGDWLYAQKGRGAFKNGEKIMVPDSSEKNLRKAWVAMNHYGDATYETIPFKVLDRKLRSGEGAALVTREAPHSGVVKTLIEQRKKLTAVVHDNNPLKMKQGPWDIIPAQLILEEAGGIMMTMDQKKVNPFVQEPFIAAANLPIAEAIAQLAHPKKRPG